MSTQTISAAAMPATAGRGLPPGAVAIMLMLCLSWGFNQIAVKLALPDIPPMLQAMIRSAGALPVMLIVGWLRGVNFFQRDGTLLPGLCAGLLFGIEFVLIYEGLLYTSASRAVVFLYIAPFFVGLGSYFLLGERMRAVPWAGVALGFVGVALAIGVPPPNVDANVLYGDLLMVCGGALWAATTLVVKATPLVRAPAEKGLGYQVAVSIPIKLRALEVVASLSVCGEGNDAVSGRGRWLRDRRLAAQKGGTDYDGPEENNDQTGHGQREPQLIRPAQLIAEQALRDVALLAGGCDPACDGPENVAGTSRGSLARQPLIEPALDL